MPTTCSPATSRRPTCSPAGARGGRHGGTRRGGSASTRRSGWLTPARPTRWCSWEASTSASVRWPDPTTPRRRNLGATATSMTCTASSGARRRPTSTRTSPCAGTALPNVGASTVPGRRTVPTTWQPPAGARRQPERRVRRSSAVCCPGCTTPCPMGRTACASSTWRPSPLPATTCTSRTRSCSAGPCSRCSARRSVAAYASWRWSPAIRCPCSPPPGHTPASPPGSMPWLRSAAGRASAWPPRPPVGRGAMRRCTSMPRRRSSTTPGPRSARPTSSSPRSRATPR